jgi:hypothetical protein
MKARVDLLLPILAAVLYPAATRTVGAEPRRLFVSEFLQQPDGQRLAGRVGGDAASGFQFVVPGRPPVKLQPGATLAFEGKGLEPIAGFPPFRIELGEDRRISGRLGRIDASVVRLDESSTGLAVSVARPGVSAVVQRLGEMQILEDGFETLDGSRWTLTGDPQIVAAPRISGLHSLRIPGGEASLTCRLAEPVGAGRLDVAFHDGGELAANQQWFVDLQFRGPSGAETIRVSVGWAEENLSIESPGGPALAVQRLARKTGWHRLSVRFGPDRTEAAVDGNDLAHGKGPGGPLVEIRLASHNAGKADAPDGLAGYFDDLRVVRFAEPAAGLEIDPSQDEIRVAGGDQVFGIVRSGDDERLRAAVDGRELAFGWSEVSGVYFRRAPAQGEPIDGLLVRAEWRAAPGDDPSDLDQVEGALIDLDDSTLTIATSYAGTLRVPRDRMRRLSIVGRGRRIVVDATAHHLGNELAAGNLPLDPPQPEGGVLETEFVLKDIAGGRALLSLDVVQVAGEAPGLLFSDKVRQGELRTTAFVNDTRVDYLNRYIHSKNESRERIRLPIPAGVLRKGRNRLRLEQTGQADEPAQLDDLGVLEIAIEFDPDALSDKP